MRGRTLILVGFLVLVAAVAGIFLLPRLTGGGGTATPGPGTVQPTRASDVSLPTPTPFEFVEIVVAVQEIPRGLTIPPNAVALRAWPAISAPTFAITNLEDVIGRIARTDIFREQPVLTNMLVDNLSELGRVGSDAAAILPTGLVAITIPVDRITSVAYALQPGDRVDVIISMLFVDVDEEFQSIVPNELCIISVEQESGTFSILECIEGRFEVTSLGPSIISPLEQQRPRLVSQRTVQEALVIRLGEFPPDGRIVGVAATPSPAPAAAQETPEGATAERTEGTPAAPVAPARPDLITLGVTPQDAVTLVWATEARLPLTMALRSAADTSRAPTEAVTLDYMMSTYNIELPGRRTFAIEPAIRSIRELLVSGSSINLLTQRETQGALEEDAQVAPTATPRR